MKQVIILSPSLNCILENKVKMSEDVSDGTPSEEKPEVMEKPSNEVLPHESVPHLIEAEILQESSQDQHGQVTQNVSNREEGDICINENPLTEKLLENLPSSLPSGEETTEDLPTECIETVSLDTEPELEETMHEQSNTTPLLKQVDGELGVPGESLSCHQLLPQWEINAPGHGITAVKEKAGTTLRIHSGSSASLETAVPPAAETPVTQTEDSLDQSSSESIPSSPSSGSRGMLSAITSAVQNTNLERRMDGESWPQTTKDSLLREAKEKEKQRRAQQVTVERTAHYGLLFDEFQGLSHLEALEILSNESEAQIQSHLATLDGEQLETVKNDLIAIKEIFVSKELDDEVVREQKDTGEEFVSMLTDLLFELHVAATPDKLNKARKKAHEWLEEASLSTPVDVEEELNEKSEAPDEEKTQKDNKIESDKTEVDKSKTVEEIYMLSIESLAEVTARCIEQLHKVAELILHGQEVEKTAQDQAKVLTNLTSAMCNEVSSLSKKFSDSVTAAGSNMKAEVLNPIINSVLLEFPICRHSDFYKDSQSSNNLGQHIDNHMSDHQNVHEWFLSFDTMIYFSSEKHIRIIVRRQGCADSKPTWEAARRLSHLMPARMRTVRHVKCTATQAVFPGRTRHSKRCISHYYIKPAPPRLSNGLLRP
ncbi:hypothetical protein IHE44_0012963 [Lamprotornis superbus]|uniref:Uncharacterized protein n=1 Tax=Lamprotornis superbus TaxID=245042 RepID=A0A835TZ02_9PASS|nr:hypothetical protein IHE44_0012963 [Lamprotornis superbus]